MLLLKTIYFTVYIMLNTEETNGLLMHGNPNTSTVHNTEIKEIMQILQNQSIELENLKKQAENDRSTINLPLNPSIELENLKKQAENDRSTINLLLNQSIELENLKKQAENDRSTINLLLNQSIELENLKKQAKNKSHELDSLKRETENDRTTIKRLLNQSNELEQKVQKDRVIINSLLTQNQNLMQNMTSNEENDKKETDRLNDVVKHMTDLNVQERYTSLSLLDIQTMAEEINGSMMQQIGHLIAKQTQKVAFTAGVTSDNATWNSGTLIFNLAISNVGNGYNPSTGVFTSPVARTYVFYVTAVEYNKQYLLVDIVLNSVSKVRLSGANDAYQTGTNMVVLNLQTGDRVWVRHAYGTGYDTHDVTLTTFTGFMI